MSGYGQLAWRLQQDERVRVHDRVNIRELTVDLIDGPVDVVVGTSPSSPWSWSWIRCSR